VEEPAANESEFLTAAAEDSLSAGAAESEKFTTGFANCASAAGLNKTSRIAAPVATISKMPMLFFI
jgi:hypothetical protein